MTNYYDYDYEERGIDFDLYTCLEYNGQFFDVADIERVLAVWEGANDGDDWRWVLSLKDGRFVFLQGGCDYTGWDCVSSADATVAKSAQDAAANATQDVQVYAALMQQLTKGKDETWREKTDKEFGL